MRVKNYVARIVCKLLHIEKLEHKILSDSVISDMMKKELGFEKEDRMFMYYTAFNLLKFDDLLAFISKYKLQPTKKRLILEVTYTKDSLPTQNRGSRFK